MQVCPPETHGTLMYPLQLLTGDVPLAAILGMSAATQLGAVADRRSVQAPPTPSMLGIPVPQMGTKCWCCSSDQGVPIARQDEEEW